MLTATKKIPGGKMLRIHAEIENNIIKKIQISGDFFLHPEELIDEIERSIEGTDINDIDTLYAVLREKTADAVLIGITSENIIDTLKEMTEHAMEINKT